MPDTYRKGIEQLQSSGLLPMLNGIKRGIEKESLRVTGSGRLAQTPHPKALGSALTHPHITTDYSEALLELITPAFENPDDCLAFLDQLHRYTCQHINEELLWTASMPCILEDDDQIPVAHYGTSNIGTMKTVYRIGLGHRYGRKMQTIAGIHYNFSMPDSFWPSWQQIQKNTDSLQDFRTNSYFAMIRNFRRYNWLFLYLFGASPAACKSFLKGRNNHLEELDDYTLFHPYATSLRMGDFGYTSKAQDDFIVNYNSLEEYINTLGKALLVPHPDYEKIGLKGKEGWRQLNTSLLQIENEFYSTVRPKRSANSGESPLNALKRAGVEYIELRCLDLDLFSPLGINLETIHFIDCFMLYCLLECSQKETLEDFRNIRHNLKQVVNNGRNTKTLLKKSGKEISIAQWGKELLERILDCSALLDSAHQTSKYSDACRAQLNKLENPLLTPSGRIASELEKHQQPFFAYAMTLAKKHTEYFKSRPLDKSDHDALANIANTSLTKQQEIESSDTMDFESFLEDYFRRAKACCSESPKTDGSVQQ